LATVFAPASWALDTWDGSTASEYAGGDGTEIAPYTITTGAQLAFLVQQVNAGDDTTGVYYKLADDIDLNGSAHTWIPIGNYLHTSGKGYNCFRGHFNGDGYVISNMRVSQTGNYAGLFGVIVETALVENIALANVDVRGGNCVGALVGNNDGGGISNCVATGQVAGNNYVGGLAGYNEYGGTISNGMSSCAVTGNNDIGGLVGYNLNSSSTVSNSTSDGRITGNDDVGGLIGRHYGTLSNSFAAGKVQGQSNVGPRAGYASGSGTITNTIYDTQGTGFSTGADLVKKATWELTTGNAVAGLGGSWTYKSGYYPRPKTFETIAQDGIKIAAAFAASPIFLNEGDSTADVNHGFKVSTKTADDTPITWAAVPADMADIDPATGAVALKYIGSLTLTGKSGLHSKTYALTVHNIYPSTEYRTVNFNSDGGNYTPASQNVGIGNKVEEPTPPTKDEYVFAGWYWDTKMWDFENDTVTENMTLVAHWRDPSQTAYTVTFNSVGGSSVTSQTVSSGGKVTRPANPTRAGYTFAGWYRDADYTVLWDFDTTVSANITLYAKWTPTGSQTSYTVTFNSAGGSNVPSQIVSSGGKVARPTDPARGGYFFTGWYRDAAYSQVWDFDTDVVTSDITLYANWVSEGGDSKSSGGGCSASGLGAGILALAGLELLKKRTRR
jgi:uncharacterized repeat protein (TIGR02543 family)